MKPLTLDDLLPLDEFAARRRELFQAHLRYLDRARRVRIGPRATLLFENRQTLWFRVQEILRVARLTEETHVQQELDLHNRLLPRPGHLQASLVLSIADESRLAEELAPFRELGGANLCLHLGATALPADLLTARPEDRCVGTAHWVRFVLDEPARRLLADRRVPVHVAMTLPEYRHESAPLAADLRQSLLEDLRDAEGG